MLAALFAFVAASCGNSPRGTIRVGFLGSCKGPPSTWYDESVAGAELPFIERGAKPLGPKPSDGITSISIDGKRVELVLGCDFAGSDSNELAEMRQLVEQRGVDVLVNEPSLTVEDAELVDDYAVRQPNVTFFGGDPPDATSNMFRFNPDGPAVSAGLGAYAYRTLGWRTAVTLGEDDSFGWPITAGFVAEFCSLGGTVVARYWTPFSSNDWPAKVRQIPKGVDGVALMAGFQATNSFFAAYRRMQTDLPQHVVMSAYPLALGGTAPAGIVSAGYLPLTSRARSWSRYLREFAAAYPRYAKEAGGATDIFSYNPVSAALDAIDRVHGDLSAGQRRFRTALGRVRLKTPVGIVRLDNDHRYVGPNFLMRMEKSAGGRLVPRTIRVVPNVDASHDGALDTAHPDPATRTEPVCRKGHAPAWAH